MRSVRFSPRHLLAATTMLAAVLVGDARAQQPAPLVTLAVRDESLSTLLQALAVQHRLSLVTGDQVAGKVTIQLYDVPLDDALRQILATQGLTFVKEGTFYRVLTLEQARAQELAADAFDTRVYPLNHLTTSEAQRLLQPLLSGEGKLSATTTAAGSANGGSSSAGSGGTTGDAGSGQRQAIVVRDRGSVLANLERTLAQLDRPPVQVLLEATILSVDLGEDNRLGVDLNVLGGIDFNGAGASSDLTGLTGYDTSGGQLDGRLLSGQTFGFAGAPSQGLAFGFIQNNVAAFVDALERTTNATIVSNPRVVALNGEEAKIIVGGRLGYSTVTQNQTSTIEQVNFLETGTQLTFRPYLGDDGWIRMDVHPQNSAGVVDPVSGIPSESTTEITTKILMRDGQTLVLGGLIGESVTTTRDQIPLLGSLPLIGWLFGRTSDAVTRRELVILLTPHILDPVRAAAEAERTRARFAAVKRSHWDALSPYVRPALAKRLFADAQVLQRRGEPAHALGAVERALAMDPTFADAAVLREELLAALALRTLPDDDTQGALQLLRTLPTTAGGAR